MKNKLLVKFRNQNRILSCKLIFNKPINKDDRKDEKYTNLVSLGYISMTTINTIIITKNNSKYTN